MAEHQLKTLTLVAGGLSRPDLASLIEMETSDRHPRVTFFADALNTDELDEKFLRRSPLWRRFFYKLMPITAAQVIEAFIIKNRYDAVISWAEKLGLPFAILMKITGSRVPHIGLFGWPAIGNKGRLLKYLHPQFDRIIMWSTVQREKVIRELGVPTSKIVLIKWPVDHQFFRPLSRSVDMICAAGSEMRDYPTLVEAMRSLPITCHIAAGTLIEKNTEWEKAVQDNKALPPNVTVGRKTPLEIRELYARSRFVVIPLHQTDTDNGITCILEAFAMGKTVICSRTRGQLDVIQEGKTGIFVPVGDSVAMRAAIQKLWNNPDEAERMGREARRYVEQYATLEEFVRFVRQIVEQTVPEDPDRVLEPIEPERRELESLL